MASSNCNSSEEDQLKFVIDNANIYYYQQRAALVQDSGVPLSTTNKIIQGVAINPTYNNVFKLYQAIKKRAKSGIKKSSEKQ